MSRFVVGAGVALLCGTAAALTPPGGGVTIGGAAGDSVCYPTPIDAAAAMCATYPRTQVLLDGTLRSWSCVDFSEFTLSLTASGSDGYYAESSVDLSYSTCDPDEKSRDLAELWGLGLTACALVWSCKTFVYRLVANQ